MASIPADYYVSCTFQDLRSLGAATPVITIRKAFVQSKSLSVKRIICYAPYQYTTGSVPFIVSLHDGKGNITTLQSGQFAVSYDLQPIVNLLSLKTLTGGCNGQCNGQCMQANLQWDKTRFEELSYIQAPETLGAVNVFMTVFHQQPFYKPTIYSKAQEGEFRDLTKFDLTKFSSINLALGIASLEYCPDVVGNVITNRLLRDTFVVFSVSPAMLRCNAHPFNTEARGFTPFVPAITAFSPLFNKQEECSSWQSTHAKAQNPLKCACTLDKVDDTLFALEPLQGYGYQFSQLHDVTTSSAGQVVGYRSIVPDQGCGYTGQQCFYDTVTKALITSTDGKGATVDLVSPNSNYIDHFFLDTIPWNFCCNGMPLAECQLYYKNRPNENCTGSTCKSTASPTCL